MRNNAALFSLILLITQLAGCGQVGPLYLPPHPPKPPVPATSHTTLNTVAAPPPATTQGNPL